MSEPTVFIVDDNDDVRDSLKWLISSVNLPVELFASAEEFLDSYDPSRPGCILLDIRMPGLSGLELQEQLYKNRLAPPVLLITGHGDVSMAVRGLKADAFDFIEKPYSDQVLLERIQQALALDHERRSRLEKTVEFERRLAVLTTRERQVFEHVITGKPNKVIAGDLGLSQKTVEVHRSHVMSKMKAKSLADLVKMAVALGIDPLPA